MRAIYTRKEDLVKKIKSYFKTQENGTPRMFRIYIGLSKQVINAYKQKHPDGWDAIKDAEDIILATLEQKLIYDDNDRRSSTGIIFTLRAYDAQQYIPELRDKQLGYVEQKAVIKLDFAEPKKKGER